MINNILEWYGHILYLLAKLTVHTLETVGIAIVICGSFRVLLYYLKRAGKRSYEYQNTVITLGRSLALALEFKMGAEIVNTVIVREPGELLILGLVIILRAILAFLIHWEITTEEKEERAHRIARDSVFDRRSPLESEKDNTE